MKSYKEKLREIAIEMAELYATKTKTNYDVNIEEDIYIAITSKKEGVKDE